ncbi:PTS system ascorbate-specific transporter subunit IIC [Sodalis glossinidius str. 'morsitans']|uniref:PTS system ascorbate-specific transporter subunit IIC n=1 Tax=Sodalis glossinidius (strain morsitans) TaxID=343509 RepID=A0A193QJU0_SODGM|nr:PTS system ascorbate-specific transporter subunit IIC [Sodalis glossinidius str. 'morsitans']
MDAIIHFIVKDFLGQAAILIALIAMLGLILQKNPLARLSKVCLKPYWDF